MVWTDCQNTNQFTTGIVKDGILKAKRKPRIRKMDDEHDGLPKDFDINANIPTIIQELKSVPPTEYFYHLVMRMEMEKAQRESRTFNMNRCDNNRVLGLPDSTNYLSGTCNAIINLCDQVNQVDRVLSKRLKDLREGSIVFNFNG